MVPRTLIPGGGGDHKEMTDILCMAREKCDVLKVSISISVGFFVFFFKSDIQNQPCLSVCYTENYIKCCFFFSFLFFKGHLILSQQLNLTGLHQPTIYQVHFTATAPLPLSAPTPHPNTHPVPWNTHWWSQSPVTSSTGGFIVLWNSDEYSVCQFLRHHLQSSPLSSIP